MYKSILVAVEFDNPADLIAEFLRKQESLSEYAFSIGEFSVKKIKVGSSQSELLVSPNRVQLQRSNEESPDLDKLTETIEVLVEARNKMFQSNVAQNAGKVKFCGAIFSREYDISGAEESDEQLDKMFNLDVSKESRTISYVSEDKRFNYNVSVKFDHNLRSLGVDFDVNNRYMDEIKKQDVSFITNVLGEAHNKTKDVGNIVKFLNQLSL